MSISRGLNCLRIYRSLRRVKSPREWRHSSTSSRDSGHESESEKWRRIASGGSTDSGFVSTFEDSEGNLITPRGSLTNALALRSRKPRSTIDRGTHFVDWRRVVFTAGNGGDGMISFLHIFNNDMAGPDGGDGGNGGHVVLVADAQTKSLANINSLYKGESGERGGSTDMVGFSGKHSFLKVPVGTLVKTESGETVADLDLEGSKFIAARGGSGGKGNHFFLSNENRHPRVCEMGAKGEVNRYLLEMKTVAHAGLVGFPNVGKSTLLRAITRAKPKVASYPFTTINPHVGIVHFDDYVQLAVADLPGLIPDAHKNRGLGIDFLKHIERCVCLMYVIDLSVDDPWTQLQALKYELDMFKPGLSRRPHAIVGNKMDAPNSADNLEQLRKYITESTPEGEVPLPIIPTSAKLGSNLSELLAHLRALYDLYNQPETSEDSFVCY